MTPGQATPRSLIDSDRIAGTPVYSRGGGRVGTIRRLIIDKASGRIVYVVMTFDESFGVGDVSYVIPFTKLLYDARDGGYRSDITEAEVHSALPVTQDDADWADREAGEAFFSIPPGWRTV